MTSLEDWAAFMAASGRSPRTIRTRLAAVQSLCRNRQTEPLSMTTIDVIQFLGRDLAPWSRLTYFNSLAGWAEFVRTFGGVSSFDPMNGIPKPRTPDPIARPISDAALRKVFTSHMQWKTRVYLMLALYQGLRVHEIAKIRAEDFDLEHGWLTVMGKGQVHMKLPIHPEVEKVARTSLLPGRGFWFPSLDGAGHVSAHAVSNSVARTMRRAGVDATAHRLRDTAATKLQRQQGDIRITQSFLRHKTLSSSMKYTAVDEGRLRSGVANLTWSDDAA